MQKILKTVFFQKKLNIFHWKNKQKLSRLIHRSLCVEVLRSAVRKDVWQSCFWIVPPNV